MLKKISNGNKTQSAAKGAMYYLVCQLVVRALSFFSVPIFSRLLTKSEYGIASNFTAWVGLLFAMVTLNLRDTINKSKYVFPQEQKSYLLSVLCCANISTVLFYVVVELKMSFFVSLFSLNATYIRLLFIYLIFYTCYDFVKLELNVNREYALYAIYMLLIEVTTVLTSVLLVIHGKDKLTGRITGYIAPTILINLLVYLFVIIKGKRIRLKYLKFALGLSIPLIPSALSKTVLVISDRAMITNILDSEKTALYQMGYSVAMIISLIWTALNQAYCPWFYDNLSKGNRENIRKKTNIYIIGYSFIAASVMLMAPEVLTILGGKAYKEALPVIPPVTLGMIFQFFYAFYYDIEYYFGKVKLISSGAIIAASTNFILNLIFIPKFGYIAAAYTTLIGYMLLFLFHYSICRFILRQADVISKKHIFIFAALLIAIQYVSYFLYDKGIIRLIMLIALIACCLYYLYLNKDLVEKIINKKKRIE